MTPTDLVRDLSHQYAVATGGAEFTGDDLRKKYRVLREQVPPQAWASISRTLCNEGTWEFVEYGQSHTSGPSHGSRTPLFFYAGD